MISIFFQIYRAEGLQHQQTWPQQLSPEIINLSEQTRQIIQEQPQHIKEIKLNTGVKPTGRDLANMLRQADYPEEAQRPFLSF